MQISKREASWLIIIMICAKVFFTDIMIFVHTSGTAAHLQALVCIAFELILYLVVWSLYKRINQNNIFDCIRFSFGKWGLVICGCILFFLQILNISAVLKMYSETLSSLTLTSSPIWFISLFIIISMIGAVYFKFRGLIGVATSFGAIILILFVSIIVLDINHYDTTNIFPILGNGIGGIIKGISGISIFNDIFFLFYISDHFSDKKSVGKTGIITLLTTSAVTLIATLSYTFAIPYPLSTKFYMPIFQISSDVTTDVVIQRAEALFLLLWIMSSYIYMGAHFYFLTQTFKNSFSSSDNRAIVPISLIIIITTATFWQNINEVSPFLSVLKNITTIVIYTLLISSFSISIIKSRKEKGNV